MQYECHYQYCFKNTNFLPEFQKKYPDYLKPDSKKSDEYNQIIMETMGGVPGNGEKNKEKIIRNIAKKVVIDKIGQFRKTLFLNCIFIKLRYYKIIN